MSPETRQLLAYINAQPKGRVGYPSYQWGRINALATEALDKLFIKPRRLGAFPGFQITDKGRAYLAGEDLDA